MPSKNPKKLAEEIAATYNPKRLAPFPYENIMEAVDDLTIIHTSLDDPDVSGVIMVTDGEYSILINTQKAPNRQNFTLGHELGHYFLHKDLLRDDKDGFIDTDNYFEDARVLYRLDNTERNEIEREANQFAAALLMPEDLVRDAWDATQNIVRLAEIFQVSIVAMSIRLTEIGLVDA